MDILGVRQLFNCERYLGLPMAVGRNKRIEFRALKERLWKRLHSWEGKSLSQAGKSILIKAVAQAIPTFVMSFFHLLKALIHDMDMMVAKFLWEDSVNKKRIHWKA